MRLICASSSVALRVPSAARSSALQFASLATALVLSAASLVLTGCGIGTAASPLAADSISGLAGNIHGGNSPIDKASMYLYLTTAAGYNGTPTLLGTTTSSNGTFTFPTINYAGTGSCTATSQVYLLGVGGNPGLGGSYNNTAIVMAAALGPCTTVSAAPPTTIQINEVTTVAAAYALAGFAPSSGFPASTGSAPTVGFTTSSTNVQGIVDAFANAANLAPYTGAANTATTSGGVVPNLTINTVADILGTCANSQGVSDPNGYCTSLFNMALSPSGSKPASLLQAAINIAQNPAILNTVGVSSASSLYGLIVGTPAFQSYLSAAPADYSIAIIYPQPATTLKSGTAMAIDNYDNIYLSSPTAGDQLVEFSPQGALLSGSTGFGSTINAADGLRSMQFDPSGNLWISDSAKVTSTAYIYEYTPAGAPTAPTQGVLTQQFYTSVNTNSNNYTIALDQKGDVWTETYKAGTCTSVLCELVEFVPSVAPVTYTPYVAFSGNSAGAPGVGGARVVAYDVNTNNIWYGDICDNLLDLFKVTPGTNAVATSSAAPTTITLGGSSNETTAPASYKYGTWGIAIDKNSNAWVTLAGGPAVTTGTVTSAVTPAIYEYNASGTLVNSLTSGGLSTPANVVVDGANNIFVANSGANGIVEYNTLVSQFQSESGGFVPTTLASNTSTLYAPQFIAVDRSGALWTFSTGSGTAPASANLVQIFGIASPTNPILAAGQYGVKP